MGLSENSVWKWVCLKSLAGKYEMGLSENSVPLHPMVNDHCEWCEQWEVGKLEVGKGTNGFVWKCCVPHCTQWFCWSLSLLNGYFIGNINPTFSDKPTCHDFSWLFDLFGGCEKCGLIMFARQSLEWTKSTAIATVVQFFSQDSWAASHSPCRDACQPRPQHLHWLQAPVDPTSCRPRNRVGPTSAGHCWALLGHAPNTLKQRHAEGRRVFFWLLFHQQTELQVEILGGDLQKLRSKIGPQMVADFFSWNKHLQFPTTKWTFSPSTFSLRTLCRTSNRSWKLVACFSRLIPSWLFSNATDGPWWYISKYYKMIQVIVGHWRHVPPGTCCARRKFFRSAPNLAVRGFFGASSDPVYFVTCCFWQKKMPGTLAFCCFFGWFEEISTWENQLKTSSDGGFKNDFPLISCWNTH